MKLLLIGPLKDMSGFALASRNMLRALLQDSSLDIVARAVTYDRLDDGQKFQIPQWLAACFDKNIQNVDMCLQALTCNEEAIPIPGIPNGLYTFFETDRLQPSWAAKAQQFDFIIVSSKYNAETLLRSGVNRPILVAAVPCDLDIYTKGRQPLKIDNAEGRTIFYNICQLSTKKGIDRILRAYFAAFASMPDEVLLVLKTYINMQNRKNDLEIVKQYIKGVRERCRIPVEKFPPILPLVYTMSEDDIQALHARGDAYVNASLSEGYCIPVADALAHGKTVISHNATGLSELVSKENSLVYGGTASLYYDMPHSDPGLYTGLEQCFEPSVAELSLTMQHFHLLKKGADSGMLDEKHLKEWESVLVRRENAKTIGQKLDYRVVSEHIVAQLKAVLKNYRETGVARYDDKNL